MVLYLFIVGLLALSSVAFTTGRRRALAFSEAGRSHSRPVHHGIYVTLWCALPALSIFLMGLSLEAPLLSALLIADTDPALVAQLGGKDIFIATVTTLAANDAAGQSEGSLRDAALHYQGLAQFAHALPAANANSRCRIRPHSQWKSRLHAVQAFAEFSICIVMRSFER